MDKKDIVDILSRHGVKPTANRILVLEALSLQERPLSLLELWERMDTLDKSSIFRTLVLFREHHLVHAIEDGSDSVRYEMCHSGHDDVDDDMHVHFFCTRCGKTYCLEDIHVPEVELPEGWRQESANYIVKGVCPDCGN